MSKMELGGRAMSLWQIRRQAWLLIVALICTCRAALLTNTDLDVKPGEPFTLTWTDARGPVDILLMSGDPKDLVTVQTLGSTHHSFIEMLIVLSYVEPSLNIIATLNQMHS
jgi:hypothetical protein